MNPKWFLMLWVVRLVLVVITGILFLAYLSGPSPVTNLALGIGSGLLALTILALTVLPEKALGHRLLGYPMRILGILGAANALRMIGIGVHWWNF
ncbi:MAG: hypothetical protein M1415_08280 [Firmicutes bacterium]|nr:hypothetical protein [Bacillota bacterium]